MMGLGDGVWTIQTPIFYIFNLILLSAKYYIGIIRSKGIP